MPGSFIKIEGADKLINGLILLSKMKEVKAAIMAGGMHLKAIVADYPPRQRISPGSLQNRHIWLGVGHNLQGIQLMTSIPID